MLFDKYQKDVRLFERMKQNLSVFILEFLLLRSMLPLSVNSRYISSMVRNQF